jgi:hypothetical protein
MTNGASTAQMAPDIAPAETPMGILAQQLKLTEERYRLFRLIVIWVGICILGYWTKDAIVALAGHSTSVVVQAGLKIISDVRFTASYMVSAGCTTWAVAERKIRQRRVRELHVRIKELETAIDPNRSSSKLTLEGKTNPRDRSLLP